MRGTLLTVDTAVDEAPLRVADPRAATEALLAALDELDDPTDRARAACTAKRTLEELADELIRHLYATAPFTPPIGQVATAVGTSRAHVAGALSRGPRASTRRCCLTCGRPRTVEGPCGTCEG